MRGVGQPRTIVGALHHHLYDLRTLILLLEKAGFEVMEVMRVLDPSGKLTVAAFAVPPTVYEAAACAAP